jgi:hypothetical protein
MLGTGTNERVPGAGHRHELISVTPLLFLRSGRPEQRVRMGERSTLGVLVMSCDRAYRDRMLEPIGSHGIHIGLG